MSSNIGSQFAWRMSAQGVSSLLGGGDTGTLSGLLQQSQSGGSILGTLSSSGTSSSPIRAVQNAQAVNQQKNNILTQAVTRLQYIADGRIKPSADWERIGAYYAQTGQPYVVTLNAKGAVTVTGQAESTYDASRYTPAERRKLKAAVDDLSTMFAKQKANDDNQALIKKLTGAGVELDAMALGVVTPQSDWERQAQLLQQTKAPFKLALDTKGNIMVQDQTTTMDYSKYSPQQTAILSKAIQTIRGDLANGTYAVGSYQDQANEYAAAGRNYYLDIDPVYNTVQVKQNTAANVVPAFLKKPPYASVGADTKWKQQALELQKAGKGFSLDIGQGGQVVVKENNAPNVIRYSQPRFSTTNTTGALLSVLT